MKSKLLFITFLMALLLPSCSENSTDDLILVNTETVKYNSQIKNIIDTNCISCHKSPPINGAVMSLTTYQDVKNAILNRGLIDRISRPQGAPGMMPIGTKLPQQLIDQIITWQNEGFAE